MKKISINRKDFNYRRKKIRKITTRKKRLAIKKKPLKIQSYFRIDPPEPFHGLQSNIFKILFNLNPLCTILSTLEDEVIVDANNAFYQITGYQNGEVIGRSTIDIGLWVRPNQREEIRQELIQKNKISLSPTKLRVKNGKIRDVLASAQLVESMEETYLLSIFMDIERQKSLEATLNDRETKIEMLSNKLEDLNIAIRVLGDAWGKEKAAIDKKLKNHLNANVFQFVEKIKQCKKNSDIQTYIRIIDNNLKDLSVVISGNRQNFTETFTPLENQVFQLVRQGKSSKEIAELLNLSIKAISFHRSNIRKKLNIVNKKINLATYLRNQDALS